MAAGESVGWARWPGGARRGDPGGDRPGRRGCRRASLSRAARRRRRRHHRRTQQRLRDFRRAGDCARAFRKRLSYYYGKVLECASFCAEPYARQGIGARRDHHGGCQGDRDAAGAALHDRLGRRTRDVRAQQSVPRVFSRRPYRHERLRLRAVRRAHLPHHRPTLRAGRRSAGETGRAPASWASASSAWSVCAIPTPSPISTR